MRELCLLRLSIGRLARNWSEVLYCGLRFLQVLECTVETFFKDISMAPVDNRLDWYFAYLIIIGIAA